MNAKNSEVLLFHHDQKILSKTFTEWKILQLKNLGFKNFCVLSNDEDLKLDSAGTNLRYSFESSPQGSGGSIRHAIQNSNFENFIVYQANTFFDVKLDSILKKIKHKFQILLRFQESSGTHSAVEVDSDFVVQGFKDKSQEEAFINSGIYFFHKSILEHLGNDFVSLEESVFPKLCYQNLLHGIPAGGFFLDLEFDKDLSEIPERISQKFKPCLFLDRDGIIIHDKNYIHKFEDITFYPEIFEIIKLAKQRKHLVCVVSNQSGVAKGIFTEEQCKELHWVLNEHLDYFGATIDEWQFCPYHKEGKLPEYAKDSYSRKPNPGMIFLAQNHHKIDLEKSIMVGDKDLDVLNLPELKYFLIKGDYRITRKLDVFKNHEEFLNYFKNH